MAREVYRPMWNPDYEHPIETGKLSPELKDFLQKFDFPLLRSFLVEHSKRSRPNSDDELNFIEQERVFNGRFSFGVYVPSDNAIGLVPWRNDDIDRNFFDVAQTLIHEELHAVTDKSHHHDYIGGYDQRAGFTLFNEGVTEKLAREITLQYFDATRQIPRDKYEVFSCYNTPVKFVDFIIEKIAESSDISATVVWQALIRGLFENDDLRSAELQQLFETAFSPEFFLGMEQAETDRELQDIMAGIPHTALSRLVSELRSRIQKSK